MNNDLPLLVCFCCRNYAGEGYTMFRGYFVCEYCLDEWLKSEEWRKNLDFEVWCINHKKELDDELNLAKGDVEKSIDISVK